MVAQLQDHRKYLYMYLDALFDKDPHLAFDYSDLQVDLYAEFKSEKLMEFLRASNYYTLERAYQICDSRDLVPEMVYLLGRMGDNKRALTLIIERLGDVQRAIDFAKEQNDTDLWEDLLKYCETKPRMSFSVRIRTDGDLTLVVTRLHPRSARERRSRRRSDPPDPTHPGWSRDPGTQARSHQDPPGLSASGECARSIACGTVVLTLFWLQISLMDGCKSILYGDSRKLALALHRGQTMGYLWTGTSRFAQRRSGFCVNRRVTGLQLIRQTLRRESPSFLT